MNHNKIIAIVGSRDCTDYGRKYAQLFAKTLAKHNITIISGLALGIDTAAHCGSMCEAGKTIAVLGGGLKDVYPKENLWLYNKILNEQGCIITEYEEQEETKKSNFPKRNRLISGIADSVLVIEASYRSGSRITAKYAKMQDKNIYCIPVNLDQKNSSGINELLRNGAKIVTTPNQLMSDLYNKEKDENQIHLNEIKDIPDVYKKIYEVLDESMSVEEIAVHLNKDIRDINSMITMMEIDGYIENISGNTFRRKEKNV